MKSNCNKCMHKEMCKYKDNFNMEEVLAKVQSDYPFMTDIDFSCKFFEKKEKVVEKAVKAEPVEEVKAENTADDKKEEKTADATEVSSFEDIRVIDFGLGDDTTSELIRMGGREMGGREMCIKDLKRFANRMSPKCKTEVNAKLQAFHRNI